MMKSKLVNITYKKGDEIKLTDEYLKKINFDERMKEINEEGDTKENKVEALDLLEEIRVGLILDYIKKHSELEIDEQEYNLLYSILKDQFDKNNIEYDEKSLSEQTINHLCEEVIYETFEKEFDVKVSDAEIEKMSELAIQYIHDFNEYSDLEKRGLIVQNLRRSKIQRIFRDYFNINFGNNMKDKN